MVLPSNQSLVVALPKGRILAEVMPLVRRAGITVEAEFANEDSRQLRFATNHPGLDVIRAQYDAYETAGVQCVVAAPDQRETDAWLASVEALARVVGVGPRL